MKIHAARLRRRIATARNSDSRTVVRPAVSRYGVKKSPSLCSWTWSRNGTARTATRFSRAISRRYQTVAEAALGRQRASGPSAGADRAAGTAVGAGFTVDTAPIADDRPGGASVRHPRGTEQPASPGHPSGQGPQKGSCSIVPHPG
ncbi:hypothetical protein GCM10025734_45530 [Kitasatospora paranensis]